MCVFSFCKIKELVTYIIPPVPIYMNYLNYYDHNDVFSTTATTATTNPFSFPCEQRRRRPLHGTQNQWSCRSCCRQAMLQLSPSTAVSVGRLQR